MERELLKETCNELQEKLTNLDTEINEALDEVHLLLHGVEDGGLKNIIALVGSQLHRMTDVSMMEIVNTLTDLEAGIIIDEEEQTELGKLPGLTMHTVVNGEGDIVDIDEKPVQKRGRRKKSDQTLDEIFKDDEFMKV